MKKREIEQRKKAFELLSRQGLRDQAWHLLPEEERLPKQRLLLADAKKKGDWSEVAGIADQLPEPQRTAELQTAIDAFVQAGCGAVAEVVAGKLGRKLRQGELRKILDVRVADGKFWGIEKLARQCKRGLTAEQLTALIEKAFKVQRLTEATALAAMLPEPKRKKYLDQCLVQRVKDGGYYDAVATARLLGRRLTEKEIQRMRLRLVRAGDDYGLQDLHEVCELRGPVLTKSEARRFFEKEMEAKNFYSAAEIAEEFMTGRLKARCMEQALAKLVKQGSYEGAQELATKLGRVLRPDEMETIIGATLKKKNYCGARRALHVYRGGSRRVEFLMTLLEQEQEAHDGNSQRTASELLEELAPKKD